MLLLFALEYMDLFLSDSWKIKTRKYSGHCRVKNGAGETIVQYPLVGIDFAKPGKTLIYCFAIDMCHLIGELEVGMRISLCTRDHSGSKPAWSACSQRFLVAPTEERHLYQPGKKCDHSPHRLHLPLKKQATFKILCNQSLMASDTNMLKETLLGIELFFSVLQIEPRTSHMQGKCFSAELQGGLVLNCFVLLIWIALFWNGEGKIKKPLLVEVRFGF